LSRTSRIFLNFHYNSAFQVISHFLIISDVIHAFLLAWYRTDKLSIQIPSKQQGLAIFPITNSFRLSVPDTFEEHNLDTWWWLEFDCLHSVEKQSSWVILVVDEYVWILANHATFGVYTSQLMFPSFS
jgi:hypothetical protein